MHKEAISNIKHQFSMISAGGYCWRSHLYGIHLSIFTILNRESKCEQSTNNFYITQLNDIRVMIEWLARWTQQWVMHRCLCDSGVSGSLLAPITWSNSLRIGIYPVASKRRHDLSPPYKIIPFLNGIAIVGRNLSHISRKTFDTFGHDILVRKLYHDIGDNAFAWY